jgi:hypothetical protein
MRCVSILQHEKAPGQIVNLLRVAAEQTVDINVRQVAAISFKNIVKRNWEPAEGMISDSSSSSTISIVSPMQGLQ